MLVKVSEIKDAALDWAVGEATERNPRIYEGRVIVDVKHDDFSLGLAFTPSTQWGQGGPLIDQFSPSFTIEIEPSSGFQVVARIATKNGLALGVASSYLVAAMRAIVAAVLGEQFEMPDDVAEKLGVV